MVLSSNSAPLKSFLATHVVVTLLKLGNVVEGSFLAKRLSVPTSLRAADIEEANHTGLQQTLNTSITAAGEEIPSLELGQDYLRPERHAVKGSKWLNGIVPYTIDPQFTSYERGLIAKAFEEYAKKTCIRFVPNTNRYRDYVDIQLDNTVCGRANICRRGEKQWARIGRKPNCMTVHNILHELAHTLCMAHEHKRHDRDQFVQLRDPSQRNNPDYHIAGSDHTTLGLMYDYESIMHYSCPYDFRAKDTAVKRCGRGHQLSVLDAEKINSLYNCGGCHSYRFRQPYQAGQGVATVGYDIDGTNLGVCRGYMNGDIVPGKYRLGGGECHVAWRGKEYIFTKGFEVLTLPQSKYFSFSNVNNGKVPRNAVAGGRENGGMPLYIGICVATFNGKTTRAPGKIRYGNMYFSFRGKEYSCHKFEVLVCNS